VLPRFKYFISLSDIAMDSLSLVFADMNNRDLVKKLESKLAKYFNRNSCTTTSSFRMGVYYYLKSLKLPEGSEILVTPITIPDLINVILLLGHRPVFVDMDIETHSICAEDLNRKINSNSKVLILTYLSGIVSEQEEIKKIAEDHSLKIVEDISQAYGSKLDCGGDPFIGDLQIGSLSSGKLISTYTGGFVLSNSNDLIELLKKEIVEENAPPKRRFIFELISNAKIVLATSKLLFPLVYTLFWFMWRLKPSFMDGIAKSKMYSRSEEHDIFFDDYPIRRTKIPSGWKTYICNWQAKVGLRSLDRLDRKNEMRQELGNLFYSKINSDIRNRIPNKAIGQNFNFYHIPYLLRDNKPSELRNLFGIGVDSEGYGLNLCNEEKVFKDLWCKLPNAYKLKYESVFLPLHESYSVESISKMAKKLNILYESKRDL